MQRQLWTFTIRSGSEDAYREAHRHVWPELIAASRTAGFRNHSVYIHDRVVIAYLEAENIAAAMAGLQTKPVVTRWNAAMKDLLEEGSRVFEEIFHFD